MARIGIIGGSGLGDALAGSEGQKQCIDTPFGPPSSDILLASWEGVEVALLNRHGHGHPYPPAKIPYRANIHALKQLGCTHVIASGAVGSLREHIEPRHLVICHQVIDKTFRRTPTFFEDLAVHTEFASPFCPILRKHLLDCAEVVDTTVHDAGTYVCMEGPAFSTRAESEMHRIWGGDLIGMTVMPEARLAREAELAYALVAMPSDYDCWRPHPDDLDKHGLLGEIIGNLQAATANATQLIQAAVKHFDRIAETPSPAHSALELAVWTDRSLLDPAVLKDRGLDLLLGKYLQA
jgi:5'-methylthioadenosine phosphorylase